MSISPSSSIDLSQVNFESNQEYFEATLFGELPADVNAYTVRIRDSSIEKASLNAAKFIKLDLSRTKVTTTSLVGSNLSESSLDSVTFNNCRLTGTIFSEAYLEDCFFKNSAVTMALFRFTSFKNVCFENCNLQGADFLQSKLKNVSFKNCNLEETDFSQAKMDIVDLRNSQLSNLRGITALKGAIISSTQLIYLTYSLATEIGIIVNDN